MRHSKKIAFCLITLLSIVTLFNNCGELKSISSERYLEGQITLTSYDEGDNLIEEQVQYENRNGMAVVQGDIIVGDAPEVSGVYRIDLDRPELDRIETSAFQSGRKWTNGEIPILIRLSGENFQSNNTIIETVGVINRRLHDAFVKLRFKIITNTSGVRDYLDIRYGEEGCASWIGMKGGRQTIDIAKCSNTTIVHELGHAAGLKHEHVRADRDSFIQVKFENISSGSRPQFVKSQILSSDIGPYDYYSVMHYGTHSGSKNNEATLVPLDTSLDMRRFGPNKVFSMLDIEGLKNMYGAGQHPLIIYSRVTPRMLVGNRYYTSFDPEDEGRVLYVKSNALSGVKWQDICEETDPSKYSDVREIPDFTYKIVILYREPNGGFRDCASVIPPSSPGSASLELYNTEGNDISSNSIDLKWSRLNGATRFDVFRDGKFLKNVGLSTAFSDIGLTPERAYTYKITGITSSGPVYSNSRSFTTKRSSSTFSPNSGNEPSTTTPFTLSISGGTPNSIDLSWSDQTGASRYDVYRDGKFLRNVGLSRKFSDSGLTSGRIYRYKITAITGKGRVYSNERTVTLPN